MSKRVKPTGLITTLAGVDKALERYGVLQRQKTVVEVEMNARIDEAKRQASDKTASLEEEMAQIETAIKAFGEANRASLFVDKKTIDLDFGQLGARQSTKLEPLKGFTMPQVTAALLAGGHANAIRVKQDPDKEVLATWGDSQLQTVGMRRVKQDTIWFEVKEVELENVAGEVA